MGAGPFEVLSFIFYIIGFAIMRLSTGTSMTPVFVGLAFIVIGSIFAALSGGDNRSTSFVSGTPVSFENERADARRRRNEALNRAKIFLLPYKDIWRNITLSNKYCSLRLRDDGKTIIGVEKIRSVGMKGRKFTIVNPGVIDSNELFNLFCKNFEYNTSYDSLVEICNRCRAVIVEDIPPEQTFDQTMSSEKKQPQAYVQNNKSNVIPGPKKELSEEEKTDINNCSEIELTALPGISIVISKKIIKRREEIKGFKSVDDFLKFVNLKPNITNQLRELVIVKKMRGSLHINRNKERTVDL